VEDYDNYDFKLAFEGEYLKFEGQYLYGVRHGKGKEYGQHQNLVFEGEYIYNRKVKGIEYIGKRIEYIGEYLFAVKWNGKGYDANNNIIYELKNGNGKVIEYNNYNGDLLFEGEYLNGKKQGYGKEYCKGIINFEGEFLNGKKSWNGYVKKYNDYGKLIFEGEYLNGKINGKVKEYNFIGEIIFEGEYLNGKKWNGKEIIEKENNIMCENEYLNGKIIKKREFEKIKKNYI